MHGTTTDELDMQLLHVVQIAPRVSWARAGEIIGLSAGAVAARWDRLRQAGIAWTAVQPNPVAEGVLSAFVDITCDEAHRSVVIRRLSADPRVVSLEECAQGRDLIATVIVRGQSMLSRFLLDNLAQMAGVRRSTCRVITGLHSSGSHWRVGALDERQQRAALQVRSEFTGRAPSRGSLGVEDRALAAALCLDPRSSVTDLARTTGLTSATARRHLQRIIVGGRLMIRCDLAAQFAGWPLSLTIHARVPPADKSRVIADLTRVPQVRMCMSVTGDANLLVSAHARTLSGLSELEGTIGAIAPMLQQMDSVLDLRTHKRMGWLLDTDGRCTGEVIVPDVFADPAAG